MIEWLRRLLRRVPRCYICTRRMADGVGGILVVKTADGPTEMTLCRHCWAVLELHRDG